MVETGDFERTTALTYRHTFGSGVYLRGVPTSQAVTVGPETFITTDTHTDLGFLESRNQFGTVTTYAPTDAGNLASLTDARQHTSSLTYDWGVRKNTETPEYPIQREINPDGTVHSVTQNGGTTTFEYDVLGRQTRIHPPIGNDTWTTYAEDGTSVTVSRGNSWTRTDLDGFGRAVGTVNSQGVHTATGYDGLGRTIWVRAPWDSAHPEERKTLFAFDDPWDRVKTKKNPDDSEVLTASTVTATGLQTTITDENMHTTTQRWQATGSPDDARLVAVTDAEGHTTSYEYNGLGSLTTVTSPGGVVRTWVYNTKNQLESQTQPEFGEQGHAELGTVSYGYDAVGNLTSQTDAKNQTTIYTYDGNNRLTDVTSPDPQYSTTITYDAANNRRTLANGYVSTTFNYDEANRLRRRTDALNNRTFVSAYAFDDNGNVIDVQYPSGNHVQYRYDSENRVTSVSDPARGLTFASTITNHPAGGLAGYTSGDNVVHTFDYDSRARPSRIAAAGVLDLRYQDEQGHPGYDAVGNLTSLVDWLRPDRNATFTYDALDRLTTASGGGWGAVAYGYDDLGNREQQTHGAATTAYTYADHQRMQITGQATLQYDKNGNQTQDAIATYSYTPSNMLEAASLVAGAVYTYHYDGDNQRTVKHQGSTKTTYYLRGLGQVLSEFEQESTQLAWTIDYVYLGARLLAGVRPAAGTAALTVGMLGAGAGSVTSQPAGITCGVDCNESFPIGTVVTLLATPDAGWVFAGWSGDADCADGVVMLGRPTACYATFTATMPLFRKSAPAPFSTWPSRGVVLGWSGAPGAYEVCWYLTEPAPCATGGAGWVPAGGATTHVLEGLAAGTYHWQVRVAGSGEPADAGTWWTFTVTTPTIPADQWRAEYFANPTLTWPAASTVNEGAGFLHHDWGMGAPAGVPPDQFSARYTRTITLTAPARYRFFVLTDDGARLWVNGTLVIDAWLAMPGPTIFTTVQELGAGSHTLRFESFSGDGPATARLAWQDMATAILGPAEALRPGDVKASADGHYTVTYQADANLVVRRQAGDVAWATATAGAGTALQVTLQYDGNLVLYVDDWSPAWATGTAGNPGAWLALADDALTLRDPEGGTLWTVPLGVPLLTKTTPTAGATVADSAVTFAWTAVAGESYRVCWDPSPNQVCNATWVDAGSATTLTATGFAPGTYLVAGEDRGRWRGGRQRRVAECHGRRGADLREAGARDGDDGPGQSGDAAVDGGGRGGLRGLLGHDEQRHV